MTQFADIIASVTHLPFSEVMDFLRNFDVSFANIQDAYTFAGVAVDVLAEGGSLADVEHYN